MPASRSVARCELLLSALAGGRSSVDLGGLDPGDEVRATRDAIAALGYEVDGGPAGVVRVTGGAPDASERTVDLGAAAAAPHVAALAATGAGPVRIEADGRSRGRVLGAVAEALRKLGASVDDGSLPLTVAGPLRGGRVELSGPGSDRVAAVLLLVAPATERGVELRVPGIAVSSGTLHQAVRALEGRGVKVERGEVPNTFFVGSQKVKARDLAVPGDPADATYAGAAAAILGGRATIENVEPHAGPGVHDDLRAFQVLEAMGCRVSRWFGGITIRRTGTLYGVRENVGDIPEAFPILSVVAACAQGRSEILGAGRAYADGDGLAAVAAGLRALGANVTELADGLAIEPAPLHGGVVDAAGDGRLAMAFSILGLQVQDVAIDGAEAAAAEYPDFYEMVRGLAG